MSTKPLYQKKWAQCTAFLILIVFIVAATSKHHWSSDALYMNFFQKHYLRHTALGDDWLQMPASAYIPDQLTYFVAHLFMPINMAIWVTGLVKIVLIYLASTMLSQHLFKCDRAAARWLAWTLIITFVAPYCGNHVFPLFRIEYNHFAAVLGALLTACYLLDSQMPHGPRHLAKLYLIGFVATLCTPIALPTLSAFTLSAWLYTHGKTLLKVGKHPTLIVSLMSHPLSKIATALSSGLISGYLLYAHWINPNYLGYFALYGSPSHTLPRHLINVLNNLGDALTLPGNNHLFITLATLSITLTLSLPKTSPYHRYNRIIWGSFVICMIVLALGKSIQDIAFYRYFYGPMLLIFINTFFGLKSLKIPIPMLFCVALLGMGIEYKNLFNLKGYQFSQDLLISHEAYTLGACLQSHIPSPPEGQRTIVGVQNYWNVRTAQTLVNDRVDIMQINEDGLPAPWMQNTLTANSRIDDVFIALGGQNDQRLTLPFPIKEIINCPNGDWQLMHFGANTPALVELLKVFSQHLWSRFDLPRPYFLRLGNWLHNERVVDTALSNKMQRPTRAYFSPYIALDRGHYDIEILYSFLPSNHQSTVHAQIGCTKQSGDFDTLAYIALRPGFGKVVKQSFKMSTNPNCQQHVMLKTHLTDKGMLWINHISIYPSKRMEK